ncbi:MAG: hypothetical protein WC523_07420, partial [Patescibacteria group bacterium]
AEGALFYFPGTYDGAQRFPLIYNYSNGVFNDPSINYIRSLGFELLTESTLEVKVSSSENTIDYILAKEIAIKYDEYGAYSEGSGVYNGLWRGIENQYPQNFLLALNSESQQAVIQFLETKEVFRKKFEFSYEDGSLVITIETMNLGFGPERWIIKGNFLTQDLNTGIASLHISDEGGNSFGYLNALAIVDDKR